MGTISAQVSLYPLRQAALESTVEEAVGALARPGLQVRVGEMSTLVWGDEEAVFDALRDAFRVGTALGLTVMVATISNACPLPAGESADA